MTTTARPPNATRATAHPTRNNVPADGMGSGPSPALAGFSTAPATTVAVVQHRYGSPDVLTLRRVPKPTPGPGEVLVTVRAASLNARDWHVMRGEPRLARLMDLATFGLRRPRAATRGTDVAGVVEAVGAGVTRWQAGHAVFGEGTATFAQHAVVPADRLAAIPTGVTFEEAAALPLAGTTALLCLNTGEPVAGSTVLINGASGGVGTFALQLAKTMRLRTTAVVSPRNADLAGRLGAEHVIDYTTEDFTRSGQRYDVVVDLVGNRSIRDLRRTVANGGTLVLSGGGVSGQGRLIGPLALLIRAQFYSRLTRLRIQTPQALPAAPFLDRLIELTRTQQLTPVIDGTFPLGAAADAIRYMETEHTTGKLIITMCP
jgi:NADPH:quinone reductase-like Zn-dependent oxidoreductase